jgi:hypothetical protein
MIDRICGDSIEKAESVTHYLFRLEFEVNRISV